MGRWHAEAVRRAGGVVTAVVDPNPSAAQRLAARYRGVQPCFDLETMLEQAQPDVLHICSPLPTHVEIAERALEAGLHLLIEKPVASTSAAVACLLERAAQRRRLLCPVHQFTFQRGVAMAQHWLQGLGRLVHLEVTICSGGGGSQSGAALDEIVADILPHPLSLLQRFVPGGVSETGWTVLRPDAGELRVLSTADGVSIAFMISMSARPPVCMLKLQGTAGTVHLNLFHGYAFREPGEVSKVRKIIQPFDCTLRELCTASANLARRAWRRESAYPGLRRLVQEFYAAVRAGGDAPISAEEILVQARVRDQLIDMARTAR